MSFEILRNEKDVATYAAGQPVFAEGSAGDCMYFVLDGGVEIRKGSRVLETVESGGIFGEMALIDHQPRSADAVAAADCRVAKIGERRFLALVQQTPFFALQLMQVLTARLRKNTAT